MFFLNFSSFNLVGNHQSYFWISLFSGLYALHSLINLQNRKYVIVYLIVIGLIVYDVWFKNIAVQSSNETKNYFIKNAIDMTKKDDNIVGNISVHYKIAKALLKSDRLLWITLQRFKKIGQHQIKTYEEIVIKIVRFYEDYGQLLKSSESEIRENVIDSIIVKRQEILNNIQEFHLQIANKRDTDKEVKKLSLVVLMSLNKCIRVLKNKYRKFHASAPFAFNLMGSEFQMY